MSTLAERYPSRYQTLLREADERPLLFRRHAQEALLYYPSALRSQHRRLTTREVTPLDFLQAWQNTLVPHIESLTDAPRNTKLIKELSRSLLLDEKATITRINLLASERGEELKKEFIIEQYSSKDKTARKAAAAFLKRPVETNTHEMERAITYSLYRDIAQLKHWTIYDAHAPILQRISQGLAARRQTRQLVRRTKKALKAASAQMADIEQQNNGLIASLFALNIDLVTIRSAYQSYEKKREKLKATDRQSPTKQLALYEKETATIRSQHLESVAGITGLQEIQRLSQEIDAVLLQIFDLTNRQYNELMSELKTYRDLRSERQRLNLLLTAQ